MASYSNVFSPANVTQIGMKCEECYCLVQEADRWLHDKWHEKLVVWESRPVANVPVVEYPESDQEMLRRLIREVMELSERME